uniref:Uncharacterized protein n=1 Tax=Arundo donax TaxID=35708 RepID=A0A0A8ZJS1_ARUDO
MEVAGPGTLALTRIAAHRPGEWERTAPVVDGARGPKPEDMARVGERGGREGEPEPE